MWVVVRFSNGKSIIILFYVLLCSPYARSLTSDPCWPLNFQPNTKVSSNVVSSQACRLAHHHHCPPFIYREHDHNLPFNKVQIKSSVLARQGDFLETLRDVDGLLGFGGLFWCWWPAKASNLDLCGFLLDLFYDLSSYFIRWISVITCLTFVVYG